MQTVMFFSLLTSSPPSSCQRNRGVTDRGSVCFLLCTPKNTSTFLFCGNTGITPGYWEVHTQMLMLVSVGKDMSQCHNTSWSVLSLSLIYTNTC